MHAQLLISRKQVGQYILYSFISAHINREQYEKYLYNHYGMFNR